MRRAIAIVLGLALVGVGCEKMRGSSPQLLSQWQSRTLYTCCNVHWEKDEVSDANYYVGTLLPFGTPASVTAVTTNSVTFTASGANLTLNHSYGRDQESSQAYFAKVLVETDPHVRFGTYPPKIQLAIKEARVEKGMTREQVIMSLGYPATHRTPSLDQPTWTYWYNRWVTYTVTFGDDGKVALTQGQAPTRGEDLSAPPPPPTPAKATKPAPKKKK